MTDNIDLTPYLDPEPEARDFGHDLAASHGDNARWLALYRAQFPDCEFEFCDGDSSMQVLGVDVVVKRPTGKEFLIEQKTRSRHFNDCLVEVWSKWFADGDPRNIAGWSVHPDKATQILAYAVRPLARCWLLPFPAYHALALEVAARSNFLRRSKTISINGDSWYTKHTSVEWSVVYRALGVNARDVCFPW